MNTFSNVPQFEGSTLLEPSNEWLQPYVAKHELHGNIGNFSLPYPIQVVVGQ